VVGAESAGSRSKVPRAPPVKRTRAEEASSTVTAVSERSRTNVSDCALTWSISPTIQRARSIRFAPRSAIVVPPVRPSKRQSNGVAGSTNSSESQVARQSRTSPTAPSSTTRFSSESAAGAGS
jgi:hypothetical protein